MKKFLLPFLFITIGFIAGFTFHTGFTSLVTAAHRPSTWDSAVSNSVEFQMVLESIDQQEINKARWSVSTLLYGEVFKLASLIKDGHCGDDTQWTVGLLTRVDSYRKANTQLRGSDLDLNEAIDSSLSESIKILKQECPK